MSVDFSRFFVRMITRTSPLFAVTLLAACASSGPQVALTGQRPADQRPSLDQIAPDFRHLAGWADDDHAQAVPAILRTCEWVARQPDSRQMGSHPAVGTVGDWRSICQDARHLRAGHSESARHFFESRFKPVNVAQGEEGLFTGYYEIELRGSRTRSERYSVPLYKMPARLTRGTGKNKKTLAHPTRAQIANGALKGRRLELLWVDSAIDAFFLEIQGSGRVRLEDGSHVAVGYGGQNGHPYHPIGRELIDRGLFTREEMSLQVIRKWLKDNPGEAQGLMNLNPSYVFFQIQNDLGARGARDTKLTAGRSLAVDPGHIPLGTPLWLEVREAPVTGGEIRRLVMAQDTGGAIKGPVRGDLFWGHGGDAETAAGVMKARGTYTMLAPRHSVMTAERE